MQLIFCWHDNEWWSLAKYGRHCFLFHTFPHLSIFTQSTWYLFKHSVFFLQLLVEPVIKMQQPEFNWQFSHWHSAVGNTACSSPHAFVVSCQMKHKIKYDCQLQKQIEFRDTQGEENVDYASKTIFIVTFLTSPTLTEGKESSLGVSVLLKCRFTHCIYNVMVY